MSKQRYNRATKNIRVMAVFSKYKKDDRGQITETPLYDIYGPSYLRK